MPTPITPDPPIPPSRNTDPKNPLQTASQSLRRHVPRRSPPAPPDFDGRSTANSTDKEDSDKSMTNIHSDYDATTSSSSSESLNDTKKRERPRRKAPKPPNTQKTPPSSSIKTPHSVSDKKRPVLPKMKWNIDFVVNEESGSSGNLDRVKKIFNILPEQKMIIWGQSPYGIESIEEITASQSMYHLRDSESNKYLAKRFKLNPNQSNNQWQNEAHMATLLNQYNEDELSKDTLSPKRNYSHFPKIYAIGRELAPYSYILMEYVGHQPLSKSEDQTLTIKKLLELLNALEIMHKKGIVHGNLKPKTIRESQDGKIWITDCGSAKHIDSKEAFEENKGTLIRLPNMDKTTPENAKFRDAYAFSIILIELLELDKRLESKIHQISSNPYKKSSTPSPHSINLMAQQYLKSILQTATHLTKELKMILNLVIEQRLDHQKTMDWFSFVKLELISQITAPSNRWKKTD